MKVVRNIIFLLLFSIYVISVFGTGFMSDDQIQYSDCILTFLTVALSYKLFMMIVNDMRRIKNAKN
jgi:hypothetical protein